MRAPARFHSPAPGPWPPAPVFKGAPMTAFTPDQQKACDVTNRSFIAAIVRQSAAYAIVALRFALHRKMFIPNSRPRNVAIFWRENSLATIHMAYIRVSWL